MKNKTKCIHDKNKIFDETGTISVPIYQSATFAHVGGENTGYDYSRLQNPTREKLESIVANLENGTDALAFSTGMAAISNLMEIFQPGDHILANIDLYGGSIRLFDNISLKNKLEIEYMDFSNIELLKNSIKENTKGIFIESPSNPMMNVTDIEEVAKLAKAKDIILIVDNTFLTPYFLNPLDLGADIVVHSGSKYLGGHNDTLAGFLVVKDEELSEKLRFIYKTTGSCLSPFDSWLIIRGIKTLGLRMEESSKNALRIANWLKDNSKVKKVNYIGLEEHPEYEISKRQGRGFGSMISFEVESRELAEKILKEVKLIIYAESLGGTETLITYPMAQTHADIPEDIREARGINDRFLRLSVGIEDVEDLLEELENIIS